MSNTSFHHGDWSPDMVRKASVLSLPINASSLDSTVLSAKILGVLFGTALGDGVGLATEFMTKFQIEAYYGKYRPNPGALIPIQFGLDKVGAPFLQDRHRARFEPNCWTDDTDQAILILETILDTYTRAQSPSHQINLVHPFPEIDYKQFATRLRKWAEKGNTDMTPPKDPMGIGMTVGSVLSHPSFSPSTKKIAQDPHKAAYDVAKSNNFNLAANGAVMRCAIGAIPGFWNIESVRHNTLQIAKTTHFDDRCLASCRIVNVLVAHLLQNKEIQNSQSLPSNAVLNTLLNGISRIVEAEIDLCVKDGLRDPDELLKYWNWAKNSENLLPFELDSPRTIGYTYRAMGSGLWCLINAIKRIIKISRIDQIGDELVVFDQVDKEIPKLVVKSLIVELTMEGGDADTNGAVAGALLGVLVGYDGLPEEWVNGLHRRDWLLKRGEALLALLL
ncbi:hypothetical protein HK096_005529 [Nowakowskiella sp. JEL0078]|nr:hypothetical protein HK096_005529 [Nowakowskiella sp. JEL0078]